MPDHDPEVTPEQEARLRRLLSGARHAEPVPDDVAARLDRVLEQLAAEELDPAAHRTVVDLHARRRRRVTSLLVAAAAVVVVGVGLGQVLDLGSGSDSSEAASTADLAESAEADRSEGSTSDFSRSEEGAEADAGASQLSPVEPGASALEKGSPRPPVRLTEEAFAKQALRLRDRPGVRSLPMSVVPGEALSRSETFVCDTADWGAGRLLAALYDGVPAVLAYRPVTGETQTADLLRCGTGEILRSTVLPVGD
ncbi:hypothetical protein [Nocardioides sp.]|uniref:hypothetical protein n=1 Tax=Nocardioides sp. TaxID=35761 RepID=UPI002B26C9F9|nr:hypothetical protein [Nocardioides sp.]